MLQEMLEQRNQSCVLGTQKDCAEILSYSFKSGTSLEALEPPAHPLIWLGATRGGRAGR